LRLKSVAFCSCWAGCGAGMMRRLAEIGRKVRGCWPPGSVKDLGWRDDSGVAGWCRGMHESFLSSDTQPAILLTPLSGPSSTRWGRTRQSSTRSAQAGVDVTKASTAETAHHKTLVSSRTYGKCSAATSGQMAGLDQTQLTSRFIRDDTRGGDPRPITHGRSMLPATDPLTPLRRTRGAKHLQLRRGWRYGLTANTARQTRSSAFVRGLAPPLLHRAAGTARANPRLI
jgi:hypothetical protein